MTVQKLDLRVGGELRYAMTATASEMVEFMTKEGMELTNALRVISTDVVAGQHLAFTSLADVIPDVEPYEVSTMVTFRQTDEGVQMVLTIDAMHDELWTESAAMGWESEFGKLAQVLGD